MRGTFLQRENQQGDGHGGREDENSHCMLCADVNLPKGNPLIFIDIKQSEKKLMVVRNQSSEHLLVNV